MSVSGVITEKGGGGSSVFDSAIGTSRHSIVTRATVTGISQFSEVSGQIHSQRPHNLLKVM